MDGWRESRITGLYVRHRIHDRERTEHRMRRRSSPGIVARMNNRTIAALLALLTVVFVVLNFTVEEAGTIFLILAVAAGIGAGYYFGRS